MQYLRVYVHGVYMNPYDRNEDVIVKAITFYRLTNWSRKCIGSFGCFVRYNEFRFTYAYSQVNSFFLSYSVSLNVYYF